MLNNLKIFESTNQRLHLFCKVTLQKAFIPMSNKPSGSKKLRQSRNGRTPSQSIKWQANIGYKKHSTRNPSRKRNGEVEKQLTNCIVVYTLFLFTASILWGLQVPKQVVFVLLVIPTLLIPPYLIPLRTRYTKIVYGSVVLMIITILVAVLSFDQEAVLQILSNLFPVVSK